MNITIIIIVIIMNSIVIIIIDIMCYVFCLAYACVFVVDVCLCLLYFAVASRRGSICLKLPFEQLKLLYLVLEAGRNSWPCERSLTRGRPVTHNLPTKIIRTKRKAEASYYYYIII